MRKFLFSAFLTILPLGCSNDFSPNGPYQPKLVVYSVLSGNTDTQFVDVYATVNPSNYSAERIQNESIIAGATVVLSSAETLYSFHDTTMIVNDSGIPRSINRYVCYGAKILPNRKYDLSVNASGFPAAQTSFKTFSPGSILPLNTYLFVNSNNEYDVEVDLSLGRGSFAYLLRLCFEYEKKINGLWESKTEEVPLYYNGAQPIYPQFDFTGQALNARKLFSRSVYKQTIAKMRSNPADTIRFNYAVIELQQFDESLYTYYSVVNSFPGGSSIRLDEPDYTNIVNGYGVVGFVTRTIYRSPIASFP